MKEKDLLQDSRKIQPRLRMVADGSTSVNALRAEMCGSVMLDEQALADKPLMFSVETQRNALAAAAQHMPPPPAPESLTSLPKAVLVSVFVEISRPDTDRVPVEKARRGNIVVPTLPVELLNELTSRPDVVHVQMGEPIKAPQPNASARRRDRMMKSESSVTKNCTISQRRRHPSELSMSKVLTSGIPIS